MTLTAQTVVTPAFAGPITDKQLEHAINVATEAQANRLSDDGAALLLLVAAPIMEECLQWRRRMSLIRDVASPGNVLMFPRAGA